jgi:hypothetical protein
MYDYYDYYVEETFYFEPAPVVDAWASYWSPIAWEPAPAVDVWVFDPVPVYYEPVVYDFAFYDPAPVVYDFALYDPAPVVYEFAFYDPTPVVYDAVAVETVTVYDPWAYWYV